MPLWRRDFLQAALGLGLAPLTASSVFAAEGRQGTDTMAKTIVMIHGANEGGWVFDQFKAVFEELGWTCHAPDLIGHGLDADKKGTALIGVGMADYLAELEAFLKTVGHKSVLLGHSMGAVLAQQLAAKGLAEALVLICPAPRTGILPQTDSEKQLDQDLMGLGAFWKTVINPDFDLARVLTLNCLPEAEQRAVFDKFGPESGRAFFELFFWMFDKTGATKADTSAVTCPVLCVAGAEDHMVSVESAHATAAGYPGATFWELPGHGHMLVLEPGAGDIARRIAGWLPA
jgi:non-heme chloroperoxidase